MRDGEGSGGEPEHHDWEEAGHVEAGARVAGEVTVEISEHRLASRRRVLTDDEPHDRIDDVVQSERDQQTVNRPVNPRSPPALVNEPIAEVVDPLTDRRPDSAEENAEDDGGSSGDDRYEPATAEERQSSLEAEVDASMRSLDRD